MKHLYYKIRAQSKQSAEILIYEQIGEDFFSEGIGAKRFAQDLKALGDVRDITLRINSPGGSVFEGLAIFNTLQAHKAEITVYIDGLAASIASVIAMSGDRVIMPENALMMIHDPSGLVIGTAEDMRKMAEALEKIKIGILSAYRNKTGLSEKDISDLMTDETWMTAAEAEEWGLADEVIESVKMAAHFDLSKFKNVPSALEADNSNKKTFGGIKKMKCKICESEIVNGNCPQCGDTWRRDKYDERARVTEFLAIGRQHNCSALAEEHIEKGTSPEEFRMIALKQIGNSNSSLRVTADGFLSGRSHGVFNSFGDFLQAVRIAGTPGKQADPRLFSNAASGMSEAVPSEGGFLIEPQFMTELLKRAYDTGVLASRCTRIPIGPNAAGIKINALDEKSRATGSRLGGVQVYWASEGDTVTAKKPKFRQMNLNLNKLMGISYATDELLQDSSALEAVTVNAFADEIGFVLDDVVLNGTGAGQPLGILNSGALVTVDKESGQTAKTIKLENIVNMWSRLWSRGEQNAIWVVNRDVLSQIYSMTLGTVPIFIPPGGLNAQPFSTLLGKPILSLEQCATLGSVGDIMLLDLSQYLLVDKGGVNSQSSIHVRFIYDETTFRFTYRVDGQPVWDSTLTPFKGSATVSPFVALGERA